VMVANGGVGIRGVWLTAVTDARDWRGVGIITGLGLCMRIKWGYSTSETRAIVRGCVLFLIGKLYRLGGEGTHWWSVGVFS